VESIEIMDQEKPHVLPHRAHRKLVAKSKTAAILEFLLILVMFEAPLILFGSRLTFLMSSNVQNVLPEFTYANSNVVTFNGILKNMYVFDSAAKYPSVSFSLSVASVSILLIVLAFLVASYPARFWIIYLSLLTFFSSVFFAVMPDRFPYSLKMLLELYLNIQVSVWIFIPVLLVGAFVTVPLGLASKILAITITELYSFLFGFVRYFAFIYVMSKFSYIFALPGYFAFIFVLDFLYIVSAYSLFMVIASGKLSKKKEKWKWAF